MFMVLFFMKDTGRMYGLDALRGVAMSLGIFLHSAIAYKKGYHYGEWVFDKEFNSYFFDWLYLWINSFRMQAFFLLAGFFAHLLIKKIGLHDFVKNRLKRIGLPLLLSYFTILPLTFAPGSNY
jgi:glucans biosynthesis protein C